MPNVLGRENTSVVPSLSCCVHNAGKIPAPSQDPEAEWMYLKIAFPDVIRPLSLKACKSFTATSAVILYSTRIRK